MVDDPIMERPQQLLRRLYTDNDHERSAAATALYRHMVANRLHPDDLIWQRKGDVEARRERILHYRENALTAAQRKLVFLQPRVDPKLWAQAERAARVENAWEDLLEIARRRLGDLRRGWKGRVMAMLGVGARTLRSWEAGLTKIPDSALETLRTATVPALKQRKPRSKPELTLVA
jgi:hypothetical protein